MAGEWWAVTYLIYTLEDPRDNIIRYVGKTANPLSTRLHQHMMQPKPTNPEKYQWIQELKSVGMQPIIRAIEENLTLEQVDERETNWIHYYLSVGAPLINIHRVRSYNRYQDILRRNGSSPWFEA